MLTQQEVEDVIAEARGKLACLNSPGPNRWIDAVRKAYAKRVYSQPPDEDGDGFVTTSSAPPLADTVRVYAVCAVDRKGNWAINGWSGARREDARDAAIDCVPEEASADEIHVYFIEAPLILPPQPQTVEGAVKP